MQLSKTAMNMFTDIRPETEVAKVSRNEEQGECLARLSVDQLKMLCHTEFMLSLLLLHVCQFTSICSDRPPSCMFTEEPETQNVTLNTQANFTCEVPSGFMHPFFLIDCIPLSDLSNRTERGIRLNPVTGDEASVTIQALEVNNNSNITCVSVQDGEECHSNTAFLYIYDRLPSCMFVEEPQTQNVTLNTEANFTCEVPSGFMHPFFLIDCIPLSDLSNLTKAKRGIRPNPVTGDEASVTILALEVNNNSNITCVSVQDGEECHSNTAFLYIYAIPDMSSVSRIWSISAVLISPTDVSFNTLHTRLSGTPTMTPDGDGSGNGDGDDEDKIAIIVVPVAGVLVFVVLIVILIVIVSFCIYRHGTKTSGNNDLNGEQRELNVVYKSLVQRTHPDK